MPAAEAARARPDPPPPRPARSRSPTPDPDRWPAAVDPACATWPAAATRRSSPRARRASCRRRPPRRRARPARRASTTPATRSAPARLVPARRAIAGIIAAPGMPRLGRCCRPRPSPSVEIMTTTSESGMLSRPRGTTLGVLAEQAEERFGDSSSLLFEGRAADVGRAGRARRGASPAGWPGSASGRGTGSLVIMANCPEVTGSSTTPLWRAGAAVDAGGLPGLGRGEAGAHPGRFRRRAGGDDAGTAAEGHPPRPFGSTVPGGGGRLQWTFFVVSPGSEDRQAGADRGPCDRGIIAALLYTGGTTVAGTRASLVSHANLARSSIIRELARRPRGSARGALIRAAAVALVRAAGDFGSAPCTF